MKNGWTPTAHLDGTTEWTAPSGHRYATMPLGPVLFPHNRSDVEIQRTRHITLIDERDREPDIPRRQRTRQHDRDYRINAERTRNAAAVALDGDPPF
ncbi:hypothetical protein [Mycolicibacterium neoaurum]|nr:hypothetical protein [Mycolicibacterium neoaurum]WBP93910.1 hypothetical protein O7W24_22710 [Mycolicibacterium neoaurum]